MDYCQTTNTFLCKYNVRNIKHVMNPTNQPWLLCHSWLIDVCSHKVQKDKVCGSRLGCSESFKPHCLTKTKLLIFCSPSFELVSDFHIFSCLFLKPFIKRYSSAGQRLQDVTVGLADKQTNTSLLLCAPAGDLQPHVWLQLAGSHFDITPHALQHRWGTVFAAFLHPINDLCLSERAWSACTFCCVETYNKLTHC